MWLDSDSTFVLLSEVLLQLFADHFRHVFDMSATFRRGDAVHERNLLEAFL